MQLDIPVLQSILAAIWGVAIILPLLFLMLPEADKKWSSVYETCFSSNLRSIMTGF